MNPDEFKCEQKIGFIRWWHAEHSPHFQQEPNGIGRRMTHTPNQKKCSDIFGTERTVEKMAMKKKVGKKWTNDQIKLIMQWTFSFHHWQTAELVSSWKVLWNINSFLYIIYGRHTHTHTYTHLYGHWWSSVVILPSTHTVQIAITVGAVLVWSS